MRPPIFITTLPLLLAGIALGQEPPSAPEYPKYQFLRHKEDWSTFKAADFRESDDITDQWKFIPLSNDGTTWLSVGGHFRARLESLNNFNFGLRPPGVGQDEVFVLTRALVHGDLHIGERNRVFVEIKTAQATDRDLAPGVRRTIDVDSFDLQQGFWDHTVPLEGDADLTIRLGRQGLLFGRQRLVSPLPWGNTLRAWDGASTIFSSGSSVYTGFYTQFAPVDISDFNEPDVGNSFYGLYSTHKWTDSLSGDIYGLVIDRDSRNFNGSVGAEERYTVGGRLNGNIASTELRYDVEGAYQFGRVGSSDVNAYMLAAELAYQPADVTYSPRFRFGLDVASGDSRAGGNVGTFNQLFPLGHAYLGLIDIVGRQNVADFSTGVSIKPHPRVTGRLDFHHFQLMDNDDALYNPGGGVVVAGGTSDSTTVGSEIDLNVKYKISRHSTTTVGYSHFFRSSVVEDGGGDRDVDFFYVSLKYMF